MGGKLENLEFKKQEYKPGPGTHNPEKRNDIPSMKFGSGMRSSLNAKSISPGPGNYEQNTESLKQAAPKFGFGSSTRDEIKKMQVPGPVTFEAFFYLDFFRVPVPPAPVVLSRSRMESRICYSSTYPKLCQLNRSLTRLTRYFSANFSHC